jgi:hypothetical protein
LVLVAKVTAGSTNGYIVVVESKETEQKAS